VTSRYVLRVAWNAPSTNSAPEDYLFQVNGAAESINGAAESKKWCPAAPRTEKDIGEHGQVLTTKKNKKTQ
jgi:hypothetical protein